MATLGSLSRAGTSTPPAIVVVETSSSLKKLLVIVSKASMLYLELVGQHQVAYEVHGRQRLQLRNADRGWGCRGPLSIVVLRAFPNPDIFVVDIYTLGHKAFTGRALGTRSLKAVLESPRVPKLVWDIFDPVDMLWTQFGIRLHNGLDLQLVENAARKTTATTSKQYLYASIEAALANDLRLCTAELEYNTKCRRAVEERFVLDAEREPLCADSPLLQYCANCVRYMPRLYFLYMDVGEGGWLVKAREESARRVAVALGRGCDLRSPSRALGPWGSGAAPTHEHFR